MGGGESRFSVELFMSQSARKIRRESFTVALLLGYRKSLEKRWGGYQVFTSKFFFSHRAELFRMGILYCCINFGYRKKLEKKKGEYQDSPSKNLPLTVPKVSVGNPLLLHYFQVPKKFLDKGGGRVSRFSVESFLFRSAGKFRQGIR